VWTSPASIVKFNSSSSGICRGRDCCDLAREGAWGSYAMLCPRLAEKSAAPSVVDERGGGIAFAFVCIGLRTKATGMTDAAKLWHNFLRA